MLFFEKLNLKVIKNLSSMPFRALFQMHDTMHNKAADELIHLINRQTGRQRMNAMRRRKLPKITVFVYS